MGLFAKSNLFCILATIFIILISNLNTNAQEDIDTIDSLMQKFHEYGQFDGAVLVAKGGEVIYAKAFGYANREWNIANTIYTKFRIGSITKQITAMVIMILQEKHLIDVHDPLCKYIIDCPEAWKDIRIHHLLSNSSGIPDFQQFPDNDHFERLPATLEKTIERFKNIALEFAPGTRFSYSSSGFVLAGYIIEQVTGKTYEEAAEEYIFDPLNMNSSGYDHPATILEYRASGYSKDIDFKNAVHFEMDTPHAAGALYSTVEDLFKWDNSLYATKLVSSTTIDSIFKQHIMLDSEWGYGYGWYVGKLFNRNTSFHMGSISGFRSQINRYPKDSILVVSLSNSQNGNCWSVNESIAAILFKEEYEMPRQHVVDTLYHIAVNIDVPSAINCYEELQAKFPDRYYFGRNQLNWLGVDLRNQKMYKEAIEVYEWMMLLYPEWFEVYDGIADVYRFMGKNQEAIKYYAKSLEMNPDIDYAKEIAKIIAEL